MPFTARARDCGRREPSRWRSAQPTRRCTGLWEINEADGACDRNEGAREKLLGGCDTAQELEVRDWPGTASGAEHAMFAMRGTSGVVVVRSLRVTGVRRGLPHRLPGHGVLYRIRGHRVRGHGLRRDGVHAHRVCAWIFAMREQLGGKALPTDLERERPAACRHEPRRNERTRRKRDQHDAGYERSPVTLAGAQAHLPRGYPWTGDFTHKSETAWAADIASRT
jgi:hypothetical protein